MIPKRAQEILDFWFGPELSPQFGKPQKSWFIKSESFDQSIRDRFLDSYEAASQGQLDSWQNNPKSCLALLIILDQFSRNLFRHSPQAFQCDPHALKITKKAISQGFDQQLLPVERWFYYLPFEHSESIKDQEKSLELWQTLQGNPDSQSSIEYAFRHAEVIQKFGRFPHRNQILNRKNTPAETEFLKLPGSRF